MFQGSDAILVGLWKRRVEVHPVKGRSATKYVMFYESAGDFRSTAPLHGAAHRVRLVEFQDQGTLLMAGTLSDPENGDAIAVFTTCEAAQDFIKDDPFVLHGVVRHWTIRAWNETFGPEQPRADT